MGKFKKGVRVRLIEDHDRGGPDVGALGTVFAKGIGKGQRDVIWDGLEDGHNGEANDGSTNHWYVPKSKLEVVEDEPAKRFNIGDRATALDGEQVTIDSEIDEIDHVWVVNADGKRWRTPASWLSDAWVPKVGDRVRMHTTSTWYNEGTMTVGTVVGPHPTPDCFYVRFDGDTFDWYVGVGDIYLVEKPLPVAAEAQMAVTERADAGGGFKAGDRIRLIDGELDTMPLGSEYVAVARGGGIESSVHFEIDGDCTWRPGRYFELVKPFTVEAGKFYRTRDGRKVGPVTNGGFNPKWPWTVPQLGMTFADDGTHYFWGEESNDDLVAEWVDEPVVAVKEVTATPAEPKFKVGDRVRHVNLGYVGEIKEVRVDGYYQTYWSTEGWGATDPESDLELVTDEPTPAVEPANDNTITLTLKVDSEPVADALRTIAAALNAEAA